MSSPADLLVNVLFPDEPIIDPTARRSPSGTHPLDTTAMPAITPDELLDSTAAGCGFHDWSCEGGTIRVTTDELRPVLREAYDPSMPNWPSLISWDDDHGWHVA